ncbi:TrkA-C domain protein [Limihaloglobus sulfuriphilus]|uniref:TrkA-C domain protein n=1 Tax=Limihaloglobus sulfuriphilus TaxID=1851148 RepID=A0A1Q2MG62_9BACT|nr:TrkA C-terminal domain-containing protein [Limihaloglobus sulfuriphilus]AQQ71262.1 TrkA-C domain protein [Limihaloglobus sulfuriphilus]
MSIILFLIVLVASFVIVTIGAVAFQITGLNFSLAKFQALSCFSGTGFTTRESELITSHPQRRRIASVLIVLGNAGLVTMIASVASALNAQEAIWATIISESWLPLTIPPAAIPWINASFLILIFYFVYRLFTNVKFLNKLTAVLRKRIVKRNMFNPVSIEELVVITGGYGVARFEVTEKSRILNKSLADSDLRKNDITVLAIIRQDKTIPNPSAGTTLLLGDELVSFGNLENIRNETSEFT